MIVEIKEKKLNILVKEIGKNTKQYSTTTAVVFSVLGIRGKTSTPKIQTF